MFSRKHRESPSVETLESLVGLENGTFTDEWVAEIQAKLDAIPKPSKKEYFKPPILKRRVLDVRPDSLATSMTATSGPYPAVYRG